MDCGGMRRPPLLVAVLIFVIMAFVLEQLSRQTQGTTTLAVSQADLNALHKNLLEDHDFRLEQTRISAVNSAKEYTDQRIKDLEQRLMPSNADARSKPIVYADDNYRNDQKHSHSEASVAVKAVDLVVPPSGNFERDLAERASRFEKRCSVSEPNNPFTGVWADEEITQLCQGTVMFSNFFNSKPGYQKVSGWGTQQRVSVGGTPIANLDEKKRFSFMKKWYDCVQKHNLCSIIFHDSDQADWYQREHGTQKIRFVRVSPAVYDKIFSREFGLNDVRCFFMQQAICANAAWKWIYYNDIFDVTIGKSPVGQGQPNTLYIGTDSGPMTDPWLEEGFRDIGGSYHKYWKDKLRFLKKPMWSAGLLGGDREIVLRFLEKYLAVLSDPDIAMNQKGAKTPRSSWGFQQVNMPALSFVAEFFFSGRCWGGAPFNSNYRKFETSRTDVWFIHK